MSQSEFERLCNRVARSIGITVVTKGNYYSYQGSKYDLWIMQQVIQVLSEEFDCEYFFTIKE